MNRSSAARWGPWQWVLGFWMVGIFLRVHQLDPEGLYHGDEFHYLREAKFFLGQHGGMPMVYGKPLFTALVTIGLWIGRGGILAVQYLNAIVAAGVIPLIFLLTRQLTRSAPIALTAAGLAAVDPWLTLYGRHLFPDGLTLFLLTASLVPLVSRPCPRRWVIGAGLLFGCALLSNYRCFPLGLAWLGLLLLPKDESWRQRLVNGLLWLGMVLLLLAICHGAYELLRAIRQPPRSWSYVDQIATLIRQHGAYGPRLDSWRTYPTLVLHYEGVVWGMTLLLGVVILLRMGVRNITGLCLLLTYLFPLGLAVISPFPFARVFAPILFWHPILAAIAIGTVARWLCGRTLLRIPWLPMGAAALVVLAIPRAIAIQQVRLPSQQALRWIADRQTPPYRLITSLPVIVQQLAPTWELASLIGEDRWPLPELKKQGFRFLLLFESAHYTKPLSSFQIDREPVATALRHSCAPVHRLECTNPAEFWTHLAWEHNVRYTETHRFLTEQDITHLTCIEIYDLDQCDAALP